MNTSNTKYCHHCLTFIYKKNYQKHKTTNEHKTNRYINFLIQNYVNEYLK